jgi:hypothetical protein
MMILRYSIVDFSNSHFSGRRKRQEAMFSKSPEHHPDDFAMTGEVGMHDEDVVQVAHDVSEQDEVLEDVVHHCLECGWGVGKAEVHHQLSATASGPAKQQVTRREPQPG